MKGTGNNAPGKVIENNYSNMPSTLTYGQIIDGAYYFYIGFKLNNSYGTYIAYTYDGIIRKIDIYDGAVSVKTCVLN